MLKFLKVKVAVPAKISCAHFDVANFQMLFLCVVEVTPTETSKPHQLETNGKE